MKKINFWHQVKIRVSAVVAILVSTFLVGGYFVNSSDAPSSQKKYDDVKISVVLPIYNVEPWLAECLDSIICQSHKNLEIICVNDGSKDNSLEILREYEKKDDRIKVIDQPNSGVSTARNNGMDVATGEYIAFVDPDDLIHIDTYSKAIRKAIDNDADLVSFNWIPFPITENNFNSPDKVYPDSTYLDGLRPHQHWIWNKLYRHSIITDYNIRYDKDISYCEDELFNFMFFSRMKTSVSMSNRFYYYRQRPGSLGRLVDKEKLIKSLILRYESLTNYWHTNNIGDDEILLEGFLGSINEDLLEKLKDDETRKYYCTRILNNYETQLAEIFPPEKLSSNYAEKLKILKKYAAL